MAINAIAQNQAVIGSKLLIFCSAKWLFCRILRYSQLTFQKISLMPEIYAKNFGDFIEILLSF
jgi:hypothetical protein